MTCRRAFACLVALATSGWAAGQQPPPPPTDSKALAAVLDKAFEGGPQSEAARMLSAILKGSQLGPGEGWFGPAETRYTFAWLARLHGEAAAKDGVKKDAFQGPPDLFAKLDRNKDGVIKGEDLDWSDASPYMQMTGTINRVFRRIDQKGSGGLTKEEWQAFFDRAAQGKDRLTPDDFRDTLMAGYSASFFPGDAPSLPILIRGLFTGEVGSFNEGPKVDQPAPNFVLKRADGKGTTELSKVIGEKPVVLCLGNFTCGPFRSMYPGVDDIYTRYKDRANFLMVYVREAHPTDGWKMASNARAGVEVKQPLTFDDRLGVATQFCTKLKPNLPVLVDDITDTVGHAYSGMPARLYVIDPAGKVAYKGGRGPFGFKVGEMEQALAMCLVEANRPK